MGQCINCKGFENCCNENEVDSVDIFKSQDICEDFVDSRLSIDELRAQYCKRESLENFEQIEDFSDEFYKYQGFISCARLYNLIKDGE